MERRAVLGGVASLSAASVLPMRSAIGQIPDDIRSRLTRRGKALLIGISHYDQATGWYNLPSIARNIPRLGEGLRPHFSEVEIAMNLTAAGVRQALQRVLIDGIATGDERILIYYAGHGYADFYGDIERGYLTGTNSLSNNPAIVREQNSLTGSAFSMEELDRILRTSRAAQVMVVLDCCNSGAIFTTRGIVRPPAEPSDSLRTRMRWPLRFYITAGDFDQRTPEDSPIWRIFLDGISGQADKVPANGLVSAVELGNYIRERAALETNNQITPRAAPIRDSSLGRGEFLFVADLGQATPPNTRLGVQRSQLPFRIPAGQSPGRSYLVFFDFDAALLTDRSMQIIREAAFYALQMTQEDRLRSVEVGAHMDHAVSGQRAQAITQERGDVVAAALRSFKIPSRLIRVTAFGSTRPIVPTADGVREPQNRRVEIVLRT